MPELYQTTVAGRFVIQRASSNLFDHVVAARASAMRGETAWIKCKTNTLDALEFRVRDNKLLVRAFAVGPGWEHTWADVPAWMTQARTLVDRLSNHTPQQGDTPNAQHTEAADARRDPPEPAQPAA